MDLLINTLSIFLAIALGYKLRYLMETRTGAKPAEPKDTAEPKSTLLEYEAPLEDNKLAEQQARAGALENNIE